mgnify:CR=1 FL=1
MGREAGIQRDQWVERQVGRETSWQRYNWAEI